MKVRTVFVVLTAILFVCALRVGAQTSPADVRLIEDLRAQLRSVENQEADLKIRLDQLNFDLQPENIERYFNGVGSTHPEDLRENRRRQLQTEKDNVVAQLDQLSGSRTNLEGAIQNVQSSAFQQSGEAVAAGALQAGPDRAANPQTAVRLLVVVSVALLLFAGAAILLALRRRQGGTGVVPSRR